MELSNVIIKPYHTEKSYYLRKFQESSCLAFLVDRRANKLDVKKAFKIIYNVDPVKINIQNRKSQAFRLGTLRPGRSQALKIAYIFLPKGVQIAITKDEIEEAAKNKSDSKDVKEEVKTTSVKKEEKATPKVEAKAANKDDTVNSKNTKVTKQPIRKQSKGK